MTCEIRQGDALALLRGLPAEHVQCVVTSPPYWGLRDYGAEGQLGLEATPEEYVARMVEVFEEVRRVLRPDGTLWLNLGDCYANDSKWGGSTSGKHAAGLHGATGVGRQKVTTGMKPKDLVGIPWRVAFALQAAGWWLRSDIVWSKPNPMPESVSDRPSKAHEYVFLLTKAARYLYDGEAIRQPLAEKTLTTFGTVRKGKGDASGLVKSEKLAATMPVRRPRMKQAETAAAAAAAGGSSGRRMAGFNERWDAAEATGQVYAGANRRTVWTVATQPFPEAHFAVMPEALVEPCVLAGSRPGDLVLDPFSGAGTVGVVALRHGRRYLGLELNPAYCDMARKRIAGPLFAEQPA